MVLYVLSQIWKFGGVIERLSDGQLELKNHKNIPVEVLKAAEPIFDDIDAYLKSVEGMNVIDRFTWNIVAVSAGWQKNENIDIFFRNDEKVVDLFYRYTTILALNGWVNSYQDWRQYENDESIKLKNEIYARAVAFAKGAK